MQTVCTSIYGICLLLLDLAYLVCFYLDEYQFAFDLAIEMLKFNDSSVIDMFCSKFVPLLNDSQVEKLFQFNIQKDVVITIAQSLFESFGEKWTRKLVHKRIKQRESLPDSQALWIVNTFEKDWVALVTSLYRLLTPNACYDISE